MTSKVLRSMRKVPKVVTALALLCTGGLTLAAGRSATAATPPELLVDKAPISSPVAGAFRTTVGWTIRFSCASIESNCENATLTDTLPAGLTIKTVTTAGGDVASAIVSGNSVTWHLESATTPGVLGAGSTGTLTITASAPCNATADQTFSNVATMAATNAVAPFTSDPASTITVTAASSCDPPPPPPPAKSTPSRLNAGGRMPFSLTLPYAPSQYDLIDPIPAGLNFQRASVGAPATLTVSCDSGSTYQTVDFASAGPVGSCSKSGGFWNV
jgi:fimbrial isopeptide formation D2 family protein